MKDVETSLIPTVMGSVQLRRVGRWKLPVEELATEDRTIAQLGRDGSLRIFFGPGRRVRLEDGTDWRIKAATLGRHIVPIISSKAGTVALSGPLHARRSYGINGKDYAYFLIPMGRSGLRRPAWWALRRHETEIAIIDDRRRVVECSEPIPVAAVVMAFTLMTHGIPGEGNLRPQQD